MVSYVFIDISGLSMSDNNFDKSVSWAEMSKTISKKEKRYLLIKKIQNQEHLFMKINVNSYKNCRNFIQGS